MARRDAAPTLTLAVQYASARPAPSRDRVRRWVQAAIAALDRPAASYAITTRFVDDDEARALNRDFRGRDYATNVLTFPYPDDAVDDLADDAKDDAADDAGDDPANDAARSRPTSSSACRSSSARRARSTRTRWITARTSSSTARCTPPASITRHPPTPTSWKRSSVAC